MIREKVKQYLSARRADRYEKELADKEAAYANWYRVHKRVLKQQLEEKDHTEGEKLSMEVVRYSHLRSFVLSGEKKRQGENADQRFLRGKSPHQPGLRRRGPDR